MANFSRGAAILVSIILGIVLLAIFGINEIFSLIIIGFIATYLTRSNQRSYKVGGIVGGVIGIITFIHGFFIIPSLPDFPNSSGFEIISFDLGGLLTLTFGFITLVLICAMFGSLGGAAAQNIFKDRITKSREYRVRNINQYNSKDKKPKKTFKNMTRKEPKRFKKRNINQKSFKDKTPRRSLNKKIKN